MSDLDFARQPSTSATTNHYEGRYISELHPQGLVAPSALLGEGVHTLSAEGIALYLQTRLGSLDEQIDGVFQKQQRTEYIRKQIVELQKTLSSLSENTDDPTEKLDFPSDGEGGEIDVIGQINSHIDAIALEDPELAADIRADLEGENQILGGNGQKYRGVEVTNSKEYVQGLNKQLETGAQLDMIQLQSMMSARQTAIQLATNLTASYNDSQKSIVTNIR